jgi:hypothetical protein
MVSWRTSRMLILITLLLEGVVAVSAQPYLAERWPEYFEFQGREQAVVAHIPPAQLARNASFPPLQIARQETSIFAPHQ